ncbi:hypothetical protein C8R45DRAFT_827272, partial [Mycena sanguinolenta]
TCAAGTYSGLGAASCNLCPANTISGPGASSCSACPGGTFVNGNSCSTCPPGTYSAKGATSCTSCPANTYSLGGGSTASSQCVPPPCSAGSYLHKGQCTTCSAGTFSGTSNAASCTQCTAGTISGPGASSCTTCPCPRNTYGLGGMAPCATCPTGQRAPRGSASCTSTTSPSLRPRVQHVMTCPAGHTLCPVAAGVAATECVNTQTSLESCGGCVGTGSDFQGQDCSAIENASDVSCVAGRCLVRKCDRNFELSDKQDSCVPTKSSRKAQNARRFF